MEAYLLDWLNLLLRWLHFVAGVAWIGASFYFVMLDSSLRKPARAQDTERGVTGELWAVHGGGVYQSQKFLLGPVAEPLSEHLHWSKWEAYTTWMSGFGLLVVVYWFGASSYLIDSRVMPLSVTGAIAISLGVIVAGWIFYDMLCRALRGSDVLLASIIFVLVAAVAWGLFQLLSARAAYLHVGAMMGTIMAANVFFHIIPGQKRIVAQMRAGETPDTEPGIVGKQRSVHNTYFTLPVLFIMISNHYPMTYSHQHGWLVLVFIMLAGVLIRQYFVQRHGGGAQLALPAVAAVLLLSMVWYLSPKAVDTATSGDVSTARVSGIIATRCVACHASHPTQPGFAEAPLGLVMETPEQITTNATRIATTVQSRYMPIGNLTGMTDAERAVVAAWYAQLQQQ
ncbi:MAG: urate hydroxylase PuuD [Gammaproteobacteria bacterium]|nr:urate hydroxylase PuuD [Gammaproteobacteria bacterium]MDH3446788.1 urate hydroxylase PuuD [Gammaproteobacteria bacterium]